MTKNLTLLVAAEKYRRLGYIVGLCQGKALITTYHGSKIIHGLEWDGISIILSGLVCVDFDTPLHFDVGWGRELPPTWKEKSPHGHHLFYSIDDEERNVESRVKWKPEVDLLVRDTDQSKWSSYGSRKSISIDRHVLVSPTPGYVHMYPDTVPELDDLTPAPRWLVKEVTA